MYGAEEAQSVMEEQGLGAVKAGGRAQAFPIDGSADFADCRNSGLQGI